MSIVEKNIKQVRMSRLYNLYKKVKNAMGLRLSFLNDYRIIKIIRGRPFVKTTIDEAQNIILNGLKSDSPTLIARIGGNELDAFVQLYQGKKVINFELIRELEVTAGVLKFNEIQKKFYKEYKESISNINIHAVWRKEERKIKELIHENTQRINLSDLEVFCSSNPFTRILNEKKVLIIHPFLSTISSQINSKEIEVNNYLEGLWGTKVNELLFYKPVVSHGGSSFDSNDNWITLLEKQKSELESIDFDVAIIAAGAYGLPLGNHIKTKLNKHAVVVGGVLQLYFGIIGARWESNKRVVENIPKLIWTKPIASDMPPRPDLVESKAYF